MTVTGGERVRLSDRVTVRVFPSQHACLWAAVGAPDELCLGDLGLTLQERNERFAARPLLAFANGMLPRGTVLEVPAGPPGMAELISHLQETDQGAHGDGGALVYLFETPEGSILWKDTSGHWSGILRDLRPDVALLAASGRGNIDGEPIQGSLAEFVTREVELLQPRRVILNHHDNFAPPFSRGTDLTPIRAELARKAPHVDLIELSYLEPFRALG